jgi:hypothetical protein
MSSKAIGAGAKIAVMPPESDLEMCAVEVKLLGLTARVFSEHEWLCPSLAKVRKTHSPHSKCGKAIFLWYRIALDDGRRLKGKWRLDIPLPNVASRRNKSDCRHAYPHAGQGMLARYKS